VGVVNPRRPSMVPRLRLCFSRSGRLALLAFAFLPLSFH
jgi:hypothetical protein